MGVVMLKHYKRDNVYNAMHEEKKNLDPEGDEDEGNENDLVKYLIKLRNDCMTEHSKTSTNYFYIIPTTLAISIVPQLFLGALAQVLYVPFVW